MAVNKTLVDENMERRLITYMNFDEHTHSIWIGLETWNFYVQKGGSKGKRKQISYCL